MVRKHLQDPPKRFRREDAPRLPFGRKPGPKKPVNVSVDAEVLKVAKDMNINLSQAMEDTLRNLTEDERARRFYEENKAFIDRHNELAEKYGTLSEALLREDGLLDDDDPPV